jgi:hypothetical protein
MVAVAIIDLERLLGTHAEEVVKDVFVVGEYVQETFRFLLRYTMEIHGSNCSGINWDDSSILYSTIIQTPSEATADFANLYCKSNVKCRLRTDLLDNPITNLDDFGCPRAKTSYQMPAVGYRVTDFPTRVAQRVTRVPFSAG